MFIKDHLTTSEQLALMFQAVESTSTGVVITDPRSEDNPIIYTNPAFTKITGFSAEEILGQNCRFLQAGDRNQPALDELRKALREGRATTVSLRNYKKDGTLFYNELTVSPVRDSDGELVSFVGIQNDITARVEAEARVSDFYSIVSHELRTPIAKIKSSLAVLADGEAGEINETAMRFVEISARAAENLWKLIENILDFKKLESGKFRLFRQKISLKELVSNVVTEFQPVAAEAKIKITCQSTVNAFLNADGPRLSQVLENLLSNAVKFSPAGSEVRVNIILAPANRARVEVNDSGVGIESKDLNRLFEKFQQLEFVDRRSRGGTGLGLSICKAIVEAHGGTIGVRSQTGLGSTFWFELEAESPG